MKIKKNKVVRVLPGLHVRLREIANRATQTESRELRSIVPGSLDAEALVTSGSGANRRRKLRRRGGWRTEQRHACHHLQENVQLAK